MSLSEDEIAQGAQAFVRDALNARHELLFPVLDAAFAGRQERTPEIDGAMSATVVEVSKLAARLAADFARKIVEDSADGLQSDLESAVQVAFDRGAEEWARLNYPSWIERLEANKRAREERVTC
jgi:hypothetical protein